MYSLFSAKKIFQKLVEANHGSTTSALLLGLGASAVAATSLYSFAEVITNRDAYRYGKKISDYKVRICI